MSKIKMLLALSVIFIWILGVKGQFYEDKRCRCLCPSQSVVSNNSLTYSQKLFIANVPPNKCNCDEVVLIRVSEEVRARQQEYCPRCECKYETRNTTVIMPVKDDTVIVKDDTVKDDIVKYDTVKDDKVKDDIVKDDTVKYDKVKDVKVKDDKVKDDEVKDDIVKDDKVKDVKVKDDIVKDDTDKEDAGSIFDHRLVVVVVVIVLWLLMLLSVYMGFLLCLDPLIKRKRVKPYRQVVGVEESCKLLIQGEDED
ncbi:uncharacterized protein LOC114361678 [Ostrinia furnacalis]|uniref:uncharacterized protein LOC114361678 n=1 Tax=Ostrinia furnacalis TaxID=93504 RepID=UPI00103D6912|nr:uncharacterized protein LOC114361678 [Ostrinia furnacalis]